MKKYFAEMLGTMVLVLMGCGSAVFTGIDVTNVASVLTVAFAFGLSVVAMAYTIGNISGCHINPAITLGMWITKRISTKDASFYMIFQVIGAILGSAIIYVIVNSAPQLALTTSTGANGYAEGLMMPALISEIVFTFIFVWVVLASTYNEKQSAFAGLAIGLTLVLVHIVCIPITGTSVNPARSIGPALFQGGTALSQLWLFIVAPFIGALLAGGVWRMLKAGKKAGKKA
ncbi:MAG: MIP family channel protein [Bacteroidales bacterium]